MNAAQVHVSTNKFLAISMQRVFLTSHGDSDSAWFKVD
jgi:hypothetical protein